MNVIDVPVKSLKPYGKNPRKNDKAVEFVANSIRRFGFKQPIVIDANFEIVCGHTRWKASKVLGLETVPCVMADDLTPEEIAVYRLADNKTAEVAEWDFDLLEDEFNLIDPEEFDLSDFGFFQDDEEPEKAPADIVEDEVPDLDKVESVCKRGQVWQLGNHRLMCGDSTSADDVARLMNGEKADMVFTSPPYNGNNMSSDGDVFNKKKGKKLYGNGYEDNLQSADYIQFCKEVLNICFQNVDGFIFWNVNYNANSRFEYIAQIQDRLEYLVEQIAWIKTSAIPLQGSMRRAWEPIYLFSTNKKVPNYEQVESNKWDISNTNSQTNDHKACFPIALAAKAISIIKPKNRIVLDPFGGSGSTLIACEQLDRRCFMMELDPHYCDVIIKRWEDFTGLKAELVEE